MNSIRVSALAAALVSLLSIPAYGIEIKLYPTGPAEDSAFLRFVDGSAGGLRVTAAGSQATLELGAGSRASAYMPVAGKSTIKGELTQGEEKKALSVEVRPGEFVTVLGMMTDKGLQVHTVREEADGFTAVRASVAFYNLNDACADADVQVSGRAANLFEHVAVHDWVRRQVNPVPLSVQLICGAQAVGKPLDLGTLKAGERHSLFLMPGDPADGFFHVTDSVAD